MRFLVILFLVFAIYTVLTTLMGFAKLRRSRPRRREELGGEMVQDPVCEIYIPKAAATEKMVNGRTVYFCGPSCAEAYARARSRAG